MSGEFATRSMDALVFAGGQSKRMGVSKAMLPWGESTLLNTIIAALNPLFRQVLVVSRDGRSLPGLDVEVLADVRPERGPLVGLATGLAASDAPWSFVAACDMPFLNPKVITRMADYVRGCDIVATRFNGHLQPLHAFYSKSCLPLVDNLLDSGVTSLHGLFALCAVRVLDGASLWSADSESLSFRDLDTFDDYLAARQMICEVTS
jgi:molybdenum cofactor guanylyltransferase